MRAQSLPKIARTIVARPRIATWLEVCSATPLRLLSASAGAGKTTSVVMYARSRANDCAYAELPPDVTAGALLTLLAQTVGCPPEPGYAALIEHLRSLPRTEIIVDNVDGAGDDALTLLSRLFSDAPEQVTFIYLLRNAEGLDLASAHARGLVEIFDPTLFAFDPDDVAALVQRTPIAAGPQAVQRLCDATHGWALAVAGACRTAAAYGLSLDDALPFWRRTNDTPIRELVSSAVRGVPMRLHRAIDEALAGGSLETERTLRLLSRCGLFVSARGGAPVINPLLRSSLEETFGAARSERIATATIEMFGRFSMSVDGRIVAWRRRRDRQLIAYLAMQPEGRATRAELIAAFWPDIDPQLAGQSLRTACSTIRRAIADCVGTANVGRYFAADWIVELNLARVAVSARRFADLAQRGRLADAQDDPVTALAQYRAAQRLYRAPFLSGEPPMNWALPFAQECARTFQTLSHRIARLTLERPDIAGAGRAANSTADELSA